MIRAVFVMVALLWGAVAVAAPDPLSAARGAFDDGEFEKAIKQSDRALKKKLSSEQTSQLHLLRGRSYAVLQKMEKAKDAFRSALEHDALAMLDPDTAPPDQMELFEAARAEVTGELSVTSNREGAQVRIGGRTLGPVPLRTPLPVGRHEVEVSFGDQRRSETTVVQAKTPVSVHIELPDDVPVAAAPPTSGSTSSSTSAAAPGAEVAASPAVAAAPPTVRARPSGGKGGSIAILASGVVLMGGGGFGVVHANGVKQRFDRQQDPSVTPSVTRADAQRAQWMWPASMGGVAVGAGLAAFGVIGLLADEDTGSGGGFTVSLAEDGAAVGYGGAF